MVQTNNTKSTDNIKNMIDCSSTQKLNDPIMQLKDEESSVPYDAEAYEYLDNINFENTEFNDNESDCI